MPGGSAASVARSAGEPRSPTGSTGPRAWWGRASWWLDSVRRPQFPSATATELARDLPLGVALAFYLALVVLLLALAEAEQHLHPALLQVQLERDQAVALLLHL